MLRLIARRLVSLGPTLWVVLTLGFFLIRLAPGNPFAQPRSLPPEVESALRARYGFDQPLLVQYGRFLLRLCGFRYEAATASYQWLGSPDFGESIKYRDRRVNDILRDALPVSLLLGVTSYLLALGVGCGLALLGARYRGTGIDRACRFVSGIGVVLPNFILGPMLIIAFSMTLYVFPSGRIEWLWESGRIRIPDPRSLVLPVLTLASVYITYFSRLVRAGMRDTADQLYLQTARAKGLRERTVQIRHAFRNSVLPLISFSGPALAYLVTGTVVVETIFSIPGIGRYFVDAANNRDYFLILGITSFSAIGLVIANLASDVMLAWADPRIRYD